MSGREDGRELAHPIPLLGDEMEVNGPVPALGNRFQDAMVARGVGAASALAVEAPDARTEAHRNHGEHSKFDLGIAAVAVRIVLLKVKVAHVIENAVEHESRVAVRAFDRTAVEPSVIVGDEGIELEREVNKPRAVGPLQDFLPHGEALSVTR